MPGLEGSPCTVALSDASPIFHSILSGRVIDDRLGIGFGCAAGNQEERSHG